MLLLSNINASYVGPNLPWLPTMLYTIYLESFIVSEGEGVYTILTYPSFRGES